MPFSDYVYAQLSPDWVVLGAVTGRTEPEMLYMVVASDSLTLAELRMEQEKEELRFFGDTSHYTHPVTWYELSARMSSIVIAYGPTYQEALAHLFRDWNPTEKPRPPIAPMPRELER